MARLVSRLDARNLICPMPVIRTQEHIRELAAGDELEVVATDPGVLHDIPAWCRVHGHEVLAVSEEGAEIRIRIRVGADSAQK
ncbi:MAG TPA: sulfurtransferase TusA family protein [Arenicellales bacterium]|nr:sulfurtransferase TusA family protein [Arenicellales bacterium]